MGLVDIRAAGCGHRGWLWWTDGGQLVGRAPGGRCGARHGMPFRSNVLYVACFGGYPRDEYKQWNGAVRHVDGVVSEFEVGDRDVAGGLIPRLTLAMRILTGSGRAPPPYSWARYRQVAPLGCPVGELLWWRADELLGVLGAAFPTLIHPGTGKRKEPARRRERGQL
jgi:hypothetical protein